MTINKGKLTFLMVLVLWLALAGPLAGQTTKTFTGKITEIARGTELDIAKHDVFYVIKLEEYPKIKFRMTPEEAVKFGVIEQAGPTGLVTPKMSKGMGWKVKLTCNATNLGDFNVPVYRVTSLERLEN